MTKKLGSHPTLDKICRAEYRFFSQLIIPYRQIKNFFNEVRRDEENLNSSRSPLKLYNIFFTKAQNN